MSEPASCWKPTEAGFNKSRISCKNGNSTRVSSDELELTFVKLFVNIENVGSKWNTVFVLSVRAKEGFQGDKTRTVKIQISRRNASTLC